jgi:AraC-like DNA-binding protein
MANSYQVRLFNKMVQIANSVDTSPNYFASSFKRATGVALHQYVIKQRVERAKLLLETTELPLAWPIGDNRQYFISSGVCQYEPSHSPLQTSDWHDTKTDF